MKHYLGICLVLVTLAVLTLLVIHSCVDTADREVDRVRDAFSSLLHVQPKITINERIVQTQTAPIAELAVVTREESVSLAFDEHKEIWSYEIPLTEKKLTVDGVFRVKAGFDLHEPFSVSIDPTTHQVMATLPPAKILSVEQIGDLQFKGEDSVLNRLSDDERTKAVNSLSDLAKKAAASSTLLKDAQDQVQARLQELLSKDGQSASIQWSPDRDKNGTLSPP